MWLTLRSLGLGMGCRVEGSDQGAKALLRLLTHADEFQAELLSLGPANGSQLDRRRHIAAWEIDVQFKVGIWREGIIAPDPTSIHREVKHHSFTRSSIPLERNWELHRKARRPARLHGTLTLPPPQLGTRLSDCGGALRPPNSILHKKLALWQKKSQEKRTALAAGSARSA